AVLRQNGFKTELVEHIVSVSRGLHKIKKLLLLWHWDCDSYGGSKEFTDAQAEEEAYYKDLQSVRDILTKELPDDLEIIMAYSKPAPQGLEYQTIN
ncbi:hypothetical protein HN670_02845, partial [bacterium]|nr:hypothetical protein [bacterium]